MARRRGPSGSSIALALATGCLTLAGCADPADGFDGDAAIETPVDAGATPDQSTPDPDGRLFADPIDAAVAAHDAAAPFDAQPADSGRGDLAVPDAANTPDAATPDGTTPDAEPFVEGPARYPSGRDLSPMTPQLVAGLRAIAAAHPERDDAVFAKVGASSTVSSAFMRCFDGGNVVLAAGDGPRIQGTIDQFLAGDAAGVSPYRRESNAAVVGWSARSVIAGEPSALQIEVDTINPRFALVMYGTNDIQSRTIDRYYSSLAEIADRLIAQGVIPAFSAIMPRDDDPEADAWVPAYNAIARGVAQSRQVPFMDLHRNLLPLPNHGLGGDRLHSSAAPAGACTFDNAGLQHGYNWRNLLAIRTLERLKSAVLDGGAAPDAAQPIARAAGTFEDPILIDALPFVDHRDSRAGQRNVDRYPTCEGNQNEAGPEHIYRLRLDAPTVLRAIVVDQGDVDIDVHLLSTDRQCLARAHTDLELSLEAGDWYFALDTFVGAAGDERAGPYLFALVAE